jgi:predicted ATPase
MHGQQALAQFAASPPLPLAFSYGVDLEARTRSYATALLHALGYLDQARQQNHTALVLARKLGHVQTIVATLHTIAGVHGGCREWREMQARAAELMELATAQGLLFWWAQGACSHGIALAQQGNTAEGISQIRQGLAVYRATGAALGIARVLGWLAEVCGQAGQIQEGLQALDEAFALVERHGERVWEAELYRRKGELTLQQENQSSKARPKRGRRVKDQQSEDAEACFFKAIEIARQQQAKLWELRAVMSLCRLQQQQARSTEARHMLLGIYNWFTEGFDTKDLQEAKALLKELA